MKIFSRQFFLFLLLCMITGMTSACASLSEDTKMSKPTVENTVSSEDVIKQA